MADLGNYNDKLIQDDETQQQNGASNTVTPTAGTSGVVTGAQGSGVSTAGVGAGGTGGWTNIQAYLGANKTDNGAAGLLNDKAQGQYDAENTALQTQASDAKTQAEGEANKINDAKNNSKEWVNQAANAYSWSGQQTDPYNQNVGKLKSAINDEYKGPQNFAYKRSADFQRTGSALNDNGAFNNYMNDIYKDKAGGQLSSGQGALQTQLDVNNQNLADARKNLLTKYAGFGDIEKQAVTDADAAIQKAKTDYGNNQAGLKSHLFNMGNDYQTQIDTAESNARDAYNKEYTTGVDGNRFFGAVSLPGDPGSNQSLAQQILRKDAERAGIDPYSNLSWEQLQKEHDFFGDRMNLGYGYGQDATDQYGKNYQSLNNWYASQDQKYANTADNEERNWNTIMDILGKTDRKQQGFQVRG